jgi:site-specific recombinase XerD
LKLHPHLLRHCFGSFAARAGVPLIELRDLMGHTHISSTNRYMQGTKEGQRKVSETVDRIL